MVLSPVIESVLEIGSTFQCLNKNYGTYRTRNG